MEGGGGEDEDDPYSTSPSPSFMSNRRKKYSSSWFYEDSTNVYPTIEEQIQMCRKIAATLIDEGVKGGTNAANSSSSTGHHPSRGATMFFKRVKRAQKWVHQGPGEGGEDPGMDSDADSEAAARMKTLLHKDPPKLKLVCDPRTVTTLDKLRKSGKSGAFVEHNFVQSPELFQGLAKDLLSPECNKGAAIFLRRKELSSDWIVDENNVKRGAVKQQEQKQKHIQQQQQQQQQQPVAQPASDQLPPLQDLVHIQQQQQQPTILPPKMAQYDPNEFVMKKHVLKSSENQMKPYYDFDSESKRHLYLCRAPKGWGSGGTGGEEPAAATAIPAIKAPSFSPGASRGIGTQPTQLPEQQQQPTPPIPAQNQSQPIEPPPPILPPALPVELTPIIQQEPQVVTMLPIEPMPQPQMLIAPAPTPQVKQPQQSQAKPMVQQISNLEQVKGPGPRSTPSPVQYHPPAQQQTRPSPQSVRRSIFHQQEKAQMPLYSQQYYLPPKKTAPAYSPSLNRRSNVFIRRDGQLVSPSPPLSPMSSRMSSAAPSPRPQIPLPQQTQAPSPLPLMRSNTTPLPSPQSPILNMGDHKPRSLEMVSGFVTLPKYKDFNKKPRFWPGK